MSSIIASQKKAIENCHVSRAIDPRTKFPWLVKLLQTKSRIFNCNKQIGRQLQNSFPLQ
jgi:hypothetical protein